MILKNLQRHLDLQAKISLVLVAVIVPTFLLVTIAENKITKPILEEEIRQIGIHSGKTLAAEIDSSRLLSKPNPIPAIEDCLQDILYTQPDIVRIDVVARDPLTGKIKGVGSNVEEDSSWPPLNYPLVESVISEYKVDEGGGGLWEIFVPIEHHSRDTRGPKRLLGSIHVVVSTKIVKHIVDTLWKTKAMAAAFSVVSLILLLSYFLRKTISNDRLLRVAKSQNNQLIEQLHETQRQLMTTEKMAVMGQLTASFAHEMGTPLNAIGGHLQLLREEIPIDTLHLVDERFKVVEGQLQKIEGIVKGFLQSTAKPPSQKQLVDINRITDKAIGIVNPRIDALGVDVKRNFDRNMGPIRAVPLDIEQILLNLMSNSLDSLTAKLKRQEKIRLRLEVITEVIQQEGNPWAQISVYDTGEGISRSNLKNVSKPFFTTKRPGEGTGLGLTICQQLAHKYGGKLAIDSKEGVWTRVTLLFPY